MMSRGIEVNWFASIQLLLGAEFGKNPWINWCWRLNISCKEFQILRLIFQLVQEFPCDHRLFWDMVFCETLYEIDIWEVNKL